MTRFSVPISDILGSAYYRIELTASSYNVTIDGTVTLTCTVKNIFGQAVSGYEVQLYKNGTSLGSSYNGITNNQGIVTFTYTCSTWGLIDFSIKDVHCQVNVKGFKIVTDTNQDYYLGEDIVHLYMHYNNSLTATTSWKDFGRVVPSTIAPSDNTPFMEQYGAVILRVKSDGILTYRSITGSSVNMSSLISYVSWKV